MFFFSTKDFTAERVGEVVMVPKEELSALVPEGPSGMLWKDFKTIYEEKGKKQKR